MLLCERGGTSRSEQSEEAGDRKIPSIIQRDGGSEDEQRDAPRLHRYADDRVAFEPVRRATCIDMAEFAADNEGFLRQFMRLEHVPPSHDTFSRLFRMIKPRPFAASWTKAMEA